MHSRHQKLDQRQRLNLSGKLQYVVCGCQLKDAETKSKGRWFIVETEGQKTTDGKTRETVLPYYVASNQGSKWLVQARLDNTY